MTRAFPERLSQEICKTVAGKTLLMIGSGPGDFTLQIAGQGAALSIVEQAAEKRAEIQSGVTAAGLQEQVCISDGEALGQLLEENKFDAVIVLDADALPGQEDPELKTLWSGLQTDGPLLWLAPIGTAGTPSYLMAPLRKLHTRFQPQSFDAQDGWLLLVTKRKRTASKHLTSVDVALVEQLEQAFASLSRDLHVATAPRPQTAEDPSAPGDLLDRLSLSQQASAEAQVQAALMDQTVRHANMLLDGYLSEPPAAADGPDRLLKRLQQLVTELNTARSELARLPAVEDLISREALNEVQAKHDALLSRHAHLEASVQQAEATIQKLEPQLAAQEKLTATANDTNKRLKAQLDSARKELSTLKAEISKRSNERADLKRRLTDAFKVIEQARQDLEAQKEREAQLTNLPFKRRSLQARSAGKLRVAGIMDEFTTACFAPECDFLPLDPERWQDQLIEFRPDLVFIESAWHGNGGLWHLKVSTLSPELDGVLRWCKMSGTPSIFWNKEDPVHFSVFLDIAARCNAVFTTDVDCVPSYKHHLGHDRVYALPFAAQPDTHNPIEKFERKDAFNFAGSYYLRYPERQRDIRTLIDTLSEFKPVEIYDRNYEKDHPHYKFPEDYQSMILGSLPFSEIDKAYKGYNYGINMNTIKQSQTMFARRVFEMMASNTIVVSNFSRGVRMLFGDLVICSDDRGHIGNRLRPITEDPLYYRKFRLLGLRKVMREHTYRSRLHYIMDKVVTNYDGNALPRLAMIARARSPEEHTHLLQTWAAQTYDNAQLFLLSPISGGDDQPDNVQIFDRSDALKQALADHPAEFTGLLCAADHYGPNYLTDLALAEQYSGAAGFGKLAHYRKEEDSVVLQDQDAAYRPAPQLPLRAALLRREVLTEDLLQQALDAPQEAVIEADNLLAIDEFNYCRDGAGLAEAATVTGDLELRQQGAELRTLWNAAETLPAGLPRPNPATRNLPSIGIDQLSSYLKVSASSPLKVGKTADRFVINSSLEVGKHNYLWMNRKIPRGDINLDNESTLTFDMEATTPEAHFVCEFYTEDDKKISHSMLPKGGSHALAIPLECTKLRFGLRLAGPGQIRLGKIVFGAAGTLPPVIFGHTDTLVLTKQYPAYNDLYRYGFLHGRVRSYRQYGQEVDIFRLSNNSPKLYEEFENFDVAAGDPDLLDATLASGQYRHVLVHLLDHAMWRVLSKHLDKIKVTIWIHGAEIQDWKRRAYEFPHMSEADIEAKKRRCDSYLALWRQVFAVESDNLHFVFVSDSLKSDAAEDVGALPPEERSSVIHNHINASLFRYAEKDVNQRKKILSIRPFSSVTYANDLTVATILELAKRPVFQALQFTLVGDGPLFDEVTAPVQGFDNVTLHKGFLSQPEIAALHRRNGIFLVPTRMDSQGVSRDEAMASGLVPITNRIGAVSEFVDRASGVLVPPENPVALADAIEELYSGPTKFQRLSASAAQRVRVQSGVEQTIIREIALINRDPITIGEASGGPNE